MSDITGKTSLTCLLGSPVSHSLSPAMQNMAFIESGLDYRYLAFDVKKEDIEDAVKAIRLFHIRGANLTMPLKNAVLPYLDDLSKLSKLSLSVNTIINDNGRLTGTTTDGKGFTGSLLSKGFDIRGKRALILGAGGAASSVIAEMAEEGAESIFVFQRKSATFEKAEALSERVNELTDCKCAVFDLSDGRLLSEKTSECDILINATNVGMGDDKHSLVKKEDIRKDLFCADLIYSPEETTFLREARERGARVMNGKLMLLFQGAESFYLWTGKRMPVDIIRERLFKD